MDTYCGDRRIRMKKYRVWFNDREFNVVLDEKELKKLRDDFKKKKIYELKDLDINLELVKKISWEKE